VSWLVALTAFTSSAGIRPESTLAEWTSEVDFAVCVPLTSVADAVVLTRPVVTYGGTLTAATVFELAIGGVRVPHVPRLTTALLPALITVPTLA